MSFGPTKQKKIRFQKKLTAKKRSRRVFTEMIQEDDHSFCNVKINGKSLQASPSFYGQRKNKKSQLYQNKDIMKQTFSRNKQEHSLLANWVHNTSKVISAQNSKEIKIHKRSATEQTNQKGHKKYSTIHRNYKVVARKMNHTIQQNIMSPSPIPIITYKNDVFDDKTHCNFRQMIQEFNKAKREINQSKKQKQLLEKKESRKYKQVYKKPNIYEYQQFFRQNYRAKQFKNSMIILNRFNCVQSNQNQRQKQKPCIFQNERITSYNKQSAQGLRPRTGMKKQNQVYILEQSRIYPSKSFQKTDKNVENFLTLQPYLHVKSHEFSKNSLIKTERNMMRRKSNCMNKTSFQFRKNGNVSMENNEGIQPWHYNDHNDVEF